MIQRRISLTAAFFVSAVLIAGCGQPPTSSDETSGEDKKGKKTEATGGETTNESTTVNIADSPELKEGTERYEKYVAQQTELLVERTQKFTDAVEAGNVEEAKRLYAPARVPWERIEPIAATLGDYDPDIDAREGDVPKDEWSGFHRIEKALWERNTTEGQAQYARQLMKDVEGLQGEIEKLELEPVALVTGSVELLNEVSAGKIKAFEELRPALEEADPTLASNIEQRFESVYAELEPYRKGDGWVTYTEVKEEERRELSQKVDALAEPLSQIGQVLKG
jgi:iron uptake system component EfeO